MYTTEELPKFLARRDKRVKYLVTALKQAHLSDIEWDKARELLQTYTMLLAKVRQGSASDDMEDVYNRVLNTDRDLTSLFDRSRLVTAQQQ